MTDFESEHKDTLAVYERNAQNWDQSRSRDLRELKWLEEFIRLLPAGSEILDAGCGAGEPIAKFLIDKGFKVTGIDSSQNMLEICRSRFPEHSWVRMDMRRISLNKKFAGIIAWDSFFHLNQMEQRDTLTQFSRMLLPGGSLLLTVGPEDGEALGSVNGETVYHSSLAPEEYRQILFSNGLQEVKFVANDEDCDRTVLLAR